MNLKGIGCPRCQAHICQVLEFKVLEIRYVSIRAYLVDTLVVNSKTSLKCPPRSEDYFFVLKNWKTMAQLTLTSSVTPLHLGMRILVYECASGAILRKLNR